MPDSTISVDLGAAGVGGPRARSPSTRELEEKYEHARVESNLGVAPFTECHNHILRCHDFEVFVDFCVVNLQ